MAARRATKSSSAKRVTKRTVSKKVETEQVVAPVNPLASMTNPFQDPKTARKAVMVLGLVLLLLLAFYKKEWFVAATVNGSPITTAEVFARMNQDFRKQIVQQMVDEKIIMDEARKNNALPTDVEVQAKMADIEKRVGGADALNGLLEQQGQTRSSVERQIKLQLAMEKLYANEATVSADEVSQYIAQNGATLTATDSAGKTAEATDAIRQQKLSQILGDKFQTLKNNAKVTIF